MEKLEYSAGFVINIKLDRKMDCPVIQYKRADTNERANSIDESKMKTIWIDFMKNLSMPQLLGVAGDLGIDSEKSQLTFILKHLYDLFVERDAEVIQLNPLVLTNDNKLFVNHAKIKIDVNSHYR